MSGRRVGKPIIMRSAGAVPAPRVLGPEGSARCAGGGMSSKRRSLKWPSFRATPNWPEHGNAGDGGCGYRAR